MAVERLGGRDRSVHVSEKQSLAKVIVGVRGGSSPPAEVWRQQPSKVFLLILILLLPKGGLGAQPQGFYFVFLPEGHQVR